MLGKKANPFENILILGLGGVGYYLDRRLAHEGHAVTAIEPDSGLIRNADGEIDALQFKCWKEADAAHVECLIAVTDNDAINILSAIIADRFGLPRKIARVRSVALQDKDAVLDAEDLSFTLKNAEVLHGDGSDARSLQLAGLLDMDTIITATGDNETNIMSCLLAKHLMNGKDGSGRGRQRKTIALVDKEDYLVLAGTIGADIVLNKKVLAGEFWPAGELIPICLRLQKTGGFWISTFYK